MTGRQDPLRQLIREAAKLDMSRTKCPKCGSGLDLVEATSLVTGSGRRVHMGWCMKCLKIAAPGVVAALAQGDDREGCVPGGRNLKVRCPIVSSGTACGPLGRGVL